MNSYFGVKMEANNVIVTFLKKLLVTTTGGGSLDVFPYVKGCLARPKDQKISKKDRFGPFLRLIVFTEMTSDATIR
jgi:hypothetical protein